MLRLRTRIELIVVVGKPMPCSRRGAFASAAMHAGVALRPGFIHGTRKWGSASIPLSVIGSPLESVLALAPTQSLAGIPLAGAAFVPPVSVKKVAKAAVSAATDPAVPPGPMDVWTIAKC